MRVIVICVIGLLCCGAAVLTAAAYVTMQWGFFALNLASTIGAGSVCVAMIKNKEWLR